MSASRRLRRVGTKRCLFIARIAPRGKVSVHLRLRVKADAPTGVLDNTADITPEPPVGVPVTPPPPVTTVDPPPGGTIVPVKPTKSTTATVKVTAKKKTRPTTALAPPPVTG